MSAHDSEAGIDDPALALVDLVHRRFHVVVNAPARHAAQRRKRTCMGIEQHLMTLAGIGNQPERPAGAQLQVRHLHASVDAADDQAFFAPVELEGLSLLETERDEGTRGIAFPAAPFAGEISDAAIAASVAVGPDLLEQGFGCAAVLLDAMGVSLEGLFQCGVVGRQLIGHAAAHVARRRNHIRFSLPQPFAQRIAGQPRAL